MLHHFTAGMKSVFTDIAMQGLYVIRQSIGGAGYSAWSGLPYIIEEFTPSTTFEGDNTVMAQQSIKFLAKQVKRVEQGETLNELFTYINEIKSSEGKTAIAKCAEDYLKIDVVDDCFKNIALYQIRTTLDKMKSSKLKKKQRDNEELAVDIVTMANIHIKYITFKNLTDQLPKVYAAENNGDNKKVGNLRKHIEKMICLCGLTWINDYVPIGYDSGYLEPGQLPFLNGAIKIILKQIRPYLVPLVEMFRFDDNVLCSAIGNSYGDIYEQHLEVAKNSRLNRTKGNIPDGYMEHIMPILQGKL